MAFDPANHYVLIGKGVDAVIDTASMSGTAVVSLSVDGQKIANPSFASTQQGLVVEGTVKVVHDSHSIDIRLTIPEVNQSEAHVTFTGFAVLTTALTSIAGPGLVPGALNLYEIRPVAGTASRVAS
jgi:hypothetical protein